MPLAWQICLLASILPTLFGISPLLNTNSSNSLIFTSCFQLLMDLQLCPVSFCWWLSGLSHCNWLGRTLNWRNLCPDILNSFSGIVGLSSRYFLSKDTLNSFATAWSQFYVPVYKFEQGGFCLGGLLLNSILASDGFCRLLKTLTNRLDPDQAPTKCRA